MKRNFTSILPISFANIDFSTIKSIDFVFKKEQSEEAAVIKSSTYMADGTGDAQKRDGENVIEIPFSREDTLKFEANEPFYMDPRIRLFDSPVEPETSIIKLRMNPTLFGTVNNNG